MNCIEVHKDGVINLLNLLITTCLMRPNLVGLQCHINRHSLELFHAPLFQLSATENRSSFALLWLWFLCVYHSVSSSQCHITLFISITLFNVNDEIFHKLLPIPQNVVMYMNNVKFKPPHGLQTCTKKLTKHGRLCKQNNQLPTKSYVELEDTLLWLHFIIFYINIQISNTTYCDWIVVRTCWLGMNGILEPRKGHFKVLKNLYQAEKVSFFWHQIKPSTISFFFQFLIPSSKLITYSEFLEMCRWRRDIPRCNCRFLKCGWSLYKGLRFSTYWSNSLGLDFSYHIQTNMSVTRSIIWGIRVHCIHKGEIFFFL